MWYGQGGTNMSAREPLTLMHVASSSFARQICVYSSVAHRRWQPLSVDFHCNICTCDSKVPVSTQDEQWQHSITDLYGYMIGSSLWLQLDVLEQKTELKQYAECTSTYKETKWLGHSDRDDTEKLRGIDALCCWIPGHQRIE